MSSALVRIRLLALSLTLASLTACARDAGEHAVPAADDRVQRMVALCSTHHALDAARLAELTHDDVRVLRALARDRDRPLWLRAKAVSLAGARPSDETHALWRELLHAPERELRVQAAWAEGLSLAPAQRMTFAARLLDDAEPAVREAGAHLLAIAGDEGAKALARDHMRTEDDVVVRAVLSRKLLAR